MSLHRLVVHHHHHQENEKSKTIVDLAPKGQEVCGIQRIERRTADWSVEQNTVLATFV